MWELARKRFSLDQCPIVCRQTPTENKTTFKPETFPNLNQLPTPQHRNTPCGSLPASDSASIKALSSASRLPHRTTPHCWVYFFNTTKSKGTPHVGACLQAIQPQSKPHRLQPDSHMGQSHIAGFEYLQGIFYDVSTAALTNKEF